MAVSVLMKSKNVFVSMKHLQKEEPFSSLLTPADDLAFDIPLAQHGKEKGHGIDNGDSQAQFC